MITNIFEITAEYFEKATGHKPIQDDLERCNCPDAGKDGHENCGWNFGMNKPKFMSGVSEDKTPFRMKYAPYGIGKSAKID